ncbi:MAG: hypothetical protein U1D30_23270 [Planctomycetota bacterium]
MIRRLCDIVFAASLFSLSVAADPTQEAKSAVNGPNAQRSRQVKRWQARGRAHADGAGHPATRDLIDALEDQDVVVIVQSMAT